MLFLTGMIMLTFSCEKMLYTEPILYPENFKFTGIVTTEDSVPIKNIQVILKRPVSLDNTISYTNANGEYNFKKELEFAGPNSLTLRDIDSYENGGLFQETDTVFYIREEDWDSLIVRYNFILKRQ